MRSINLSLAFVLLAVAMIALPSAQAAAVAAPAQGHDAKPESGICGPYGYWVCSELVEEIVVHIGVDACAPLRNLRALCRVLAAHVHSDNPADACEQAMLKVLVGCCWSAGVQAMIDADIRRPFYRVAELDWSGIVLPVSLPTLLRNLAVAQLLRRHYPGVEFTAEMLIEACRTGNLHLVQRVYRHLPTSVRPADAIDAAAGCGYEQIVASLHHKTDLPCTTIAMTSAAYLGRLDLVRFFLEHRTEECTRDTVATAILAGHLDVADYLRVNRNEGCAPNTLEEAPYGGCILASILWIVKHYPEQLSEDAVNSAARQSRADVVQYFHTLPSAPFTPATMDIAAASGDLDLVRWFHTNRTEGCTAEATKRAAQRGNLPIFKFLHEHGYPMCKWDTLHHKPASKAGLALHFTDGVIAAGVQLGAPSQVYCTYTNQSVAQVNATVNVGDLNIREADVVAAGINIEFVRDHQSPETLTVYAGQPGRDAKRKICAQTGVDLSQAAMAIDLATPFTPGDYQLISYTSYKQSPLHFDLANSLMYSLPDWNAEENPPTNVTFGPRRSQFVFGQKTILH
ncbi:hypothetical protein RI367_003854 [Sorochytrium milnesiophthora]